MPCACWQRRCWTQRYLSRTGWWWAGLFWYPRRERQRIRVTIAIACLNTQYKFTTVVLADSLAAYIEANSLLSAEQRALRKGVRGCVDCLAVEKVTTTDAHFKGLRTLSMGWINFKKAYELPVTWEREVVSLAAYLATIRDPIMVVVYKHLRLWAEKSSFSLLPSANKILQEAGSAAAFPENPPLSWKKVIRELQKAQEAQLASKSASKQHQGKFMSDMRRQAALNETLSVRWLTKGRLISTTEALILAAQDDCIYRARSKRTAWVLQATRTVVSVVRVSKPSGTFSACAVPRGSTSTWSSMIVHC